MRDWTLVQYLKIHDDSKCMEILRETFAVLDYYLPTREKNGPSIFLSTMKYQENRIED